MSFLRRARKRRVVPPEVALAPDTLPEGVLPHVTPTRDVHGFVVKPAFLEAYKKNVPMFEKEEEERGARWMAFLERASGERTSPVAVTSASTSGRQALRDLRETTGIHTTGATGAHRSSSTNQFDALTQILRGKTRGASGGDAPSRERELESLVRGGIPMSLRGELWQLMLGVEETRKPGVYQTLLTRVERDDESSPAARNPCSHGKAVKYDCAECTTCLSKKTREQIAKDLPRTFPGHAQLDRPSARLALQNVLLAYAAHNPHIGYCQGMNFIVGVLLLLMQEEPAFWCLVIICETILPGYFQQDMKTHLVDQEVLYELASGSVPKVCAVLDTVGCPLHAVASAWFMALFANSLPWESALRVWDVVFFEQTKAPLFQTALALLELDQMTLRNASAGVGGVGGTDGTTGTGSSGTNRTDGTSKTCKPQFPGGGAFELAATMASRAFDASTLLAHATCVHADVTIGVVEALFAKHEARMEREGFFDLKRGSNDDDTVVSRDDDNVVSLVSLDGDTVVPLTQGIKTPGKSKKGHETGDGKSCPSGQKITKAAPSSGSATVSEESCDFSSDEEKNDGWSPTGVPVPTTRAKEIDENRTVAPDGGQTRSRERRWVERLARGGKRSGDANAFDANATETNATEPSLDAPQSSRANDDSRTTQETQGLDSVGVASAVTSIELVVTHDTWNSATDGVRISSLERKVRALTLKLAESAQRIALYETRLAAAVVLADKQSGDLENKDATIQRLTRALAQRDDVITTHDSEYLTAHKLAIAAGRER